MVLGVELIMTGQPIKIIVVDNETMVRKAVKALLAEYENRSVIGEAANGLHAISLIEEMKPDIVLLDLLMPGMTGIEAIKRMLAVQPDQRIIVLTGCSQEDKLLEAIQAGAFGYVRKHAPPEELVKAIQQAYEGEPSIDPAIAWRFVKRMADGEKTPNAPPVLGEREMEVLKLLARGYTDAEIAEKMFLTAVTVRTHVSRILSKLHLKNRVEAVLYAYRLGIVRLEETRKLET
jgi:two-component system, NarL family, response regulator LiaR